MKIKIYTTPTCAFCHMVKEYLSAKKIDFEAVDVTQSESDLKEMVEKSQQMGVPVIDIDGKIIIGFDRPAIDHALNL